MDRMRNYTAIVRSVLRELADRFPPNDDVTAELILDDAAGHYELMLVGWEGDDRVHGCVVHMDVRDGKVWIQHDGTEDGLASDLVAGGIPKDHIVLAVHPSYERPYTGHAVA